MPATHYIELDEEIISAVSRLRRSNDQENIFVFPKRALILQSIINLKLLEREAKKLNKHIVVMSQDEQGMRLAEKAGLAVQEYQDRAMRESRAQATARFTVSHGENIPVPVKEGGVRKSTDIGSSEFNAPLGAQQRIAPSKVQAPSNEANGERRLRIRDMSPPPQTALNSKRDMALPSAEAMRSAPQPPQGMRPAIKRPASEELSRKEKLRRLYENRTQPKASLNNPDSEFSQPLPSSREVEPRGKSGLRSFAQSRWFTVGGGVLILLLVVGLGYIFLLPTAVVSVEPQSSEQTLRLSVIGAPENVATTGSTPRVAARYVEMEKSVRLTRETTGKETGNSAKARGTVIIANEFSSAAQPLVATTRFQTSDGKVFRLVEGVTVPGTTESNGSIKPGVIEATVIADAAGESYNVAPTSFTIPGFQGSPKFDKIKATSTKAFTGGSNSTTDAVSVVSPSDLDEAKRVAEGEAKKIVLDEVRGTLKEGEALLEASFVYALVGSPSAPPVGNAASTFEYEARFLARGFIIDEAAVRALIDKETTESGDVTLVPARSAISYGALLPNFETKQIDVALQSETLFRAPLNTEALRTELLGQDEEGIRAFLGRHPEIKRLQVEFKPKVFIATIPKNPERVDVEIAEIPE